MTAEIATKLATRTEVTAQIQSDDLLPGDVISVARQQTETNIPADILLVRGTCIVNEAMLSGESTPLVKEGADLLIDEQARGVGLDVDGAHKGIVVFSGTKILQASGKANSAYSTA